MPPAFDRRVGRVMLVNNHKAGESPARWIAALRRLRTAPHDEAARAMFDSDAVLVWDPGEDDLPLPALRLLLAWWRARMPRGGGLPPASTRVDPLELRPALGHLMIMDVAPGAADFRYRLFGTAIADRSGFDLTGKFVSQVPGPSDAVIWFLATYGAAALEGAPLYTEHTPWSAMSVTRWFRLILPLAGPDGEVARFVVGNVPGESRPASAGIIGRITRMMAS